MSLVKTIRTEIDPREDFRDSEFAHEFYSISFSEGSKKIEAGFRDLAFGLRLVKPYVMGHLVGGVIGMAVNIFSGNDLVDDIKISMDLIYTFDYWIYASKGILKFLDAEKDYRNGL